MHISANHIQPVLFISHAAVDKRLADRLKTEISSWYPEIRVFVSSDPGSLPPRDPWVHTILNNLRETKLVLVLATTRGLTRTWVWFEAGAAWDETPNFLTCCVGKMRKGSLPAPFGLYQALNLDDAIDLMTFFEELKKQFGEPRSAPDTNNLSKEFRVLEASIEDEFAVHEDPFGDERLQEVTNAISRLGKEQREAVHLLLLHGSVTEGYTLKYLAERGMAQNWNSIYSTMQIQSSLVRKVPGQSDRLRNQEVEWQLNSELRPSIELYFRRQKLAG
jgi:hypothetical protein